MNLFSWKEKKLKTVWRIERDNKSSFLVGTAHFSPVSFHNALTRLVQKAELVLFEGPLDQDSMAEVARYGACRGGAPSLYDALEPSLIRAINRELAGRPGQDTTAGSLLDLLIVKADGFLEQNARGVRPWMAFFATWTAFLKYKHSMDVEAFHIAQKLGKPIEYLETIEDQLEALDGIPFERIVNYFHQFPRWNAHRERFSKVFLEGKLQDYISGGGEFPTRCESIIGRRDPLFFQRIKSSFATGPTTAFVGVGHIPGIQKMFLDEGYRVIQDEP